jgi:hypothetical protein
MRLKQYQLSSPLTQAIRLGHQAGLVISERSIRLALVRRTLGGVHLEDIKTQTTPSAETPTWPERIKRATDFAAGFLHERHLSKVPINIGLLGDDIAFRRLYLPRIPAKELTQAVIWEGQKLFPFELAPEALYYETADNLVFNEIEQLGVNIIAAKSEIIQSAYEFCRATNLEIGQINFLPQFFTGLPLVTEDKDSRRLILFLDPDFSLALFLQSGRLEFFQRFVAVPAEFDGSPGSVAMNAIMAELHTFLDLYYAQIRGNPLQSALLCGRLASSPEAVAHIAEQIDLPCQSVESLPLLPRIIHGSDPGQISAALDAVATAMAPIDQLPLAPVAVRKKAELRSLVAPSLAALVASLVIIAVITIGQLYHTAILDNELKARQTEATAIESSNGYQGYLRLMDKLNRGRELLQRTNSEHRAQCHALLKELSLILPDPLTLTTIDLERETAGYKLYLDGTVKLTNFSPEIVLAQYVSALEKSPFFRNISVVSHQKQREGDDFKLNFQLKMDARV